MKSCIHARTGAALLVLAIVVALGAIASPAQQGSLVGQWHGVIGNGIDLTLVIEPNGQYSQLAKAGKLMAWQSGPYKLMAPNIVIFSVTDWQPRTVPLYHATGSTGGY